MSKRTPSGGGLPRSNRLTVSDEILSTSLGDLKDKVISETTYAGPDAGELLKGKDLNWRELGQYLENNKQPQSQDSILTSSRLLKNPLSASLSYRICNHCEHPILDSVIADHVKKCKETKGSKEAKANRAKSRKRKNILPESDDGSTKEPTPLVSTPVEKSPEEEKPQPKRYKKATEKAAKEKKSKATSAKPSAKQKGGPVDVERQCGVPLPNGGFCARSLTCKTHSMGAKRAVPGRSAPYDQLLAAYQRKNQARLAAGQAAAQQAQDELDHGSNIPLDEDEETHLVLEGVMRSYPLPLEKKVIMPTRLRTGFLRMREMFAGAILPRMTANPLGSLNGRAAVVNVDRPDDLPHQVRAPQRPMAVQQPGPGNKPTMTPQQMAALARARQQRAAMAQQQMGKNPQ